MAGQLETGGRVDKADAHADQLVKTDLPSGVVVSALRCQQMNWSSLSGSRPGSRSIAGTPHIGDGSQRRSENGTAIGSALNLRKGWALAALCPHRGTHCEA